MIIKQVFQKALFWVSLLQNLFNLDNLLNFQAKGKKAKDFGLKY